MRVEAQRSSQEQPASSSQQGSEELLPRTQATVEALSLLRRDAAEREEARQESRSSSWGGPSPAEAGVGPRRSDRVLATLQSSIGVEGVTDPRRQSRPIGSPERPEPAQRSAS
eukprot:6147601-Amphidinium_carterae.1